MRSEIELRPSTPQADALTTMLRGGGGGSVDVQWLLLMRTMHWAGETWRNTVPHHAAMWGNVVELTRMLPHTSTGEVQ